MTPYYTDEFVTLYCGNALEIMPTLASVDAIVTDPPYGITKLPWDRWPVGWLDFAAALTSQLWCFGSLTMFLQRASEFAAWTLAQDVVWEKHNGSNMAGDRFRRVHELAVHWYRGAWDKLYKCMQVTYDATARHVRRKQRPPQWGDIDASAYVSEDGGPRQMTSVIYARSCHGYAVNETQKPEGAVAPLVRFSVPVGGTCSIRSRDRAPRWWSRGELGCARSASSSARNSASWRSSASRSASSPSIWAARHDLPVVRRRGARA